MALKSFPRGGEKPAIKKTFHVLRDEEHKPKKKSKTQAKKDNSTEHPTAIVAERLSHITICEGMVILGQISEIFEYSLIVSIPGGMLGHVEVTNISESYTNLLQNVIDSNNAHSNELKSLSDLYDIGDHVVCYVKDINFKGKWSYNFSLEPQLINRNIYDSHLIEDMKIVCSIKSIEDHGYVVDTGIANVRAFLPIKNIDKGKQYFPGNQLFCHIKKIETADNISVVKLSAKKKKVNNISTPDVSLDVLTPKTKLQLYVTKVLSNGLQVTFGKKNIGYVNQIYLQNPLSTYTEDMIITGTLLYILPMLYVLTSKVAYFSLLSDIREEKKLNVGDIISKAKVLYRESNGIVFKLSKSGLRGFVSLRRTNVSSSKIPTEFQEGSVHRCRVLSYNWTEHLYVCTMEHEILEQKYFSVSDINFGDILDVTIKNIDIRSGFVQVQIGKIQGAVQPEHVSDIGLSALYKLKVGNIVKARVLKNDKLGVKFTLKKSLIESKLPVLYDIRDAQCGSKYHGTVVKIEKTGMLIRFYGNVKGWVARTQSSNNVYDMSWNYSLGQTVTVCIVRIEKDEERMKLKIVNEKQKNIDLSIGEIVEGTVMESSADGIHLRIDKKDEDIIGFLPANHMAPDFEIGSLLSTKYTFGDKISAFVFSKEPSVILSRTFVTQEQYKSFDLLKVGHCIPCTIKNILENGVQVILPIENYSKYGFVSYKNISNFDLLQVNQILFVKIIAINKREKQLTLAMLLRELWDSLPAYEVKMMTIVDILILYLSKVSELAEHKFYKNKPISSVTLGQKVNGTVTKITKHGLVLQLDNQLITGTVHKQHYSENLKVGDKVQGTILWKNYVHELVDVSILSRIVNSISPEQKMLPQLPTEVLLNATILMITNWFLLVLIKHNGIGYLAVLPVRRHINDISVDVTPYKIHAKIEVYVVLKANETNSLPICMLKSVFKVPKNEITNETTNKKVMIESASVTKKLKRKNLSEQQQDSTSRMIKKSKMEHQKDDVIIENKQDQSKKNKKKELDKINVNCNDNTNKQNDKVENKTCKDKDIIEEKIKIKDTDELKNSNGNKIEKDKSLMTKLHIPKCEFHWDNKPSQTLHTNVEISSDEEEEFKQKKLSAAEHHELQKKREISTSQVPNSIDQFDKLVLTNSDNSLVWLQYIDYHLQATEIDEARAVAKQALKTIDCKKENERLKVWKAWLSLESKYGTTESLNDIFHEAVRTNDDFNIYTHMLTLYTDSGKLTELNQLINTMIGKFKENPETWIECGAALLKIDLKKKSRHIMQRALQSLPDSQHINLLVKFAILENMHGDMERAQILFENILNSYPERFDVWESYLDCLIEKRDVDAVRGVLEKVYTQAFPVRKMKTLFKKFMSFEEKFGTSKGKTRVLELANAYVKMWNRMS